MRSHLNHYLTKRPRELVQRLRMLAALPEYLSSISGTPMRRLPTAVIPGIHNFCWPPPEFSQHMYMIPHTQTHKWKGNQDNRPAVCSPNTVRANICVCANWGILKHSALQMYRILILPKEAFMSHGTTEKNWKIFHWNKQTNEGLTKEYERMPATKYNCHQTWGNSISPNNLVWISTSTNKSCREGPSC